MLSLWNAAPSNADLAQDARECIQRMVSRQTYDALDLAQDSDSEEEQQLPQPPQPPRRRPAPGERSSLLPSAPVTAATKLQGDPVQPPPAECHRREPLSEIQPGAAGAFRALAALPHDLNFIVPPNTRPGQPVCLQGPHGPMHMPLPQGYAAGEQCTIRFGPTGQVQQVTVPVDAKAGDTINFEGLQGEQLHAEVPPGLKPGDVFELTPPVLMVQVPKGAQMDDEVVFAAPDGSERYTKIPRGVQAGQYFPAMF